MNVIYKSPYYTIYQGCTHRCFYVDFGQKTVRMTLCQLLGLRHKVLSIPIEDHFDGDLNKHGFEVLLLCNKEHLFIHSTLELRVRRLLVECIFIAMGLAEGREVTVG